MRVAQHCLACLSTLCKQCVNSIFHFSGQFTCINLSENERQWSPKKLIKFNLHSQQVNLKQQKNMRSMTSVLPPQKTTLYFHICTATSQIIKLNSCTVQLFLVLSGCLVLICGAGQNRTNINLITGQSDLCYRFYLPVLLSIYQSSVTCLSTTNLKNYTNKLGTIQPK